MTRKAAPASDADARQRGFPPAQHRSTAYLGGMSEIPLDEASGELAAARLDAEAEAEARRDAAADAEAELEPEAEGEL